MRIHLALALALFNMSSQRAARVLVTLYALTLGAEPFTVGMLGAMFALVPALLSWHSGKITDRFGARWPMLVGAFLVLAAVLLPYFVPTLFMLFVSGILCGLGATFSNLSLQNLVGVLSTPATRVRNYSNYTMSVSVATSLGPLLAGFAIDNTGYSTTFLLVAVVLLVPIALLTVWGGALPRGGKENGPPQALLKIVTNRRFWPILAASAIAQSGLELFQIYLPVYAHEHGLSATAIGVIVAMAAVGGFAGRLLLSRLVALSNERTVFAGALFLGAATFCAVPFFTGAVVLSVIAFVFGAGLNISQPITLVQIFSRSQAGRSGELLGVRFALDNVSRLASPILFGLIASGLGLGALFWVNALLLCAGGVMSRIDAPPDAKPPS